VLPSITLALFQTTLIMRLVPFRDAGGPPHRLHQVRPSPWIEQARRPLRPALKNTLIPVITITGLQLGSIIAFAIITETVFQWPGMGSLVIQAITFGDIPVLSAYLVLVSVLFVTINLVVDLLYYFVDPRLRVG